MIRTKSEFDYQSIIEACGIQDVTIEKAFDNKNEIVTELQEQFNILKDLSKERNQKIENLSKLKLTLDKNLQKVHKTCNKLCILNQEQKIVQEEISQINLARKSNGFVKIMIDMDDELKAFYSQIEEETLIKLLSELNIELLSTRDTERLIERSFEQLKLSSNDFDAYETPKILKNIFVDVFGSKNLEEIDMKLALKKRNIQFLTAEYNKKMELLKTFS